MKKKTRTIKVDYLARVEGEGSLLIDIENDVVKDVKLKIFEPPRFFESFMQGRSFTEAPDITARICGICPVAYQMSSVHAMENALGISVGGQLRELRRLLYCGEWIESHVLHMLMLHAPDFLGYDDAMLMAKDFPEFVKLGLKIKKIGNDIVNLVGGREIHPINVRVGGFYKVFEKHDFHELRENLLWARDNMQTLINWFASFNYPDYQQDYIFAAVSHPDEYPFNEGDLKVSDGLSIPISEYEKYFIEEHATYTNALHSFYGKERHAYLVGPLARYNLNYNQLSDLSKETAKKIGLGSNINNPFQSLLVRSVETVYAFDEAIRIIDNYERPDQAFASYEVRAGEGVGCTEAPRGLLFHRYQIDENGKIIFAKIVPPTSQNQRRIEEDLVGLVKEQSHLEEETLQWMCEQAIRNYDPCISCATHFLKMKVNRV